MYIKKVDRTWKAKYVKKTLTEAGKVCKEKVDRKMEVL
jgi:hypothetical protein